MSTPVSVDTNSPHVLREKAPCLDSCNELATASSNNDGRATVCSLEVKVSGTRTG